MSQYMSRVVDLVATGLTLEQAEAQATSELRGY